MTKKGLTNISLMFVGLGIIIILTMVYMLYFQVSVIKNNIKEGLFYTLMDGQVFLDKEQLALNNYQIDNNKLEDIFNEWAKEMVNQSINVKEIRINELLTNISKNKVTLKVDLSVLFSPIVKIKDDVIVRIKDEIDLSLLELK